MPPSRTVQHIEGRRMGWQPCELISWFRQCCWNVVSSSGCYPVLLPAPPIQLAPVAPRRQVFLSLVVPSQVGDQRHLQHRNLAGGPQEEQGVLKSAIYQRLHLERPRHIQPRQLRHLQLQLEQH